MRSSVETGSPRTSSQSAAYGLTRSMCPEKQYYKTCLEVQWHSVCSCPFQTRQQRMLLTHTSQATFGALLFSPNPSTDITLVLKPGYDFPTALLQTFESWNVDLHTISSSTVTSARGRVLYGNNASERTFERLTEPRVTDLDDLLATSAAAARCFHLFDTPGDANKWIDDLLPVRSANDIKDQPLFIWEPQAKSCSPETFEAHKAVAARVTVFSPNHAELAQFFPAGHHPAQFSRKVVEEQARAFLSPGVCIIIRCAEHGCYVLSTPATVGTWLPPYHGQESAHRVVDPTGAGNAFLGGVAMGLVQNSGDFVHAARCGSVSASFVVEGVGLPDPKSCDAWGRLIEMDGKHARIA